MTNVLTEVKVFADKASSIGTSKQRLCEATKNWYEFVTVAKPLTWPQARHAAESKAGHLVTITSSAEMDCVTQLTDKTGWIGKTAQASESIIVHSPHCCRR